MSPIERFGLVALGGAAGSMLRYWAAEQFGARPATTFAVNITGSLLIGVLAALPVFSDQRVRLLFATGFLGGYTTFSAWQLEALLSSRAGEWRSAAATLFGSLACGYAAVCLGYWVGFISRMRMLRNITTLN